MSFSSTAIKARYTGNGSTTVFSFPYLFYTNTDIEVYKDGVLQTTGYSVSGAGTDTGSVTFTTAPATGVDVLLRRIRPLGQPTVWTAGSAFPAATTEQALDKVEMHCQQLQEQLNRTPMLAADATLSSVPLAAPVAGQYLRWRSDGLGIDSVTGSLTTANFLSSGAGAVSRTVTAKLGDIISVKDFGATGDGATDDRASITNAIKYAISLGGAGVYFPRGTYLVASTIGDTTDNFSNLTLFGDGPVSTIKGTFDGYLFVKDPTLNVSNLTITGLRFLGDQPGNVAPPAKPDQATWSWNRGDIGQTIIKNLHIYNCVFEARANGVYTGPGSDTIWIHDNIFRDMHAGTQQIGYTSKGRRVWIQDNYFEYTTVNRVGDDAIAIFSGMEDVVITGNIIDRNTTTANTTQSTSRIIYENNDNNATYTSARILIANNIIRRSGLNTDATRATWARGPITATSSGGAGIVTTDVKIINNIIEDSYSGINYSTDPTDGISGLLIQGNQIRNVDTHGIHVSGGEKIKILDNLIHTYGRDTGGQAGIQASGNSTDLEIADNLVTGGPSSGTYYGITVNDGTRVLVHDNVVNTVELDGIRLISPIGPVAVENNHILSSSRHGIYISDSAVTLAGSRIVGNRVQGTPTTSGNYGIYVETSLTDGLIADNTVLSGYDGIRADGTSNARVTISRNLVKSVGQHGINWKGAAITVSDNRVYDPASRGITQLDAGNDQTITGNYVESAGDNGINLAGPGASRSTRAIVTNNIVTDGAAQGILVQDFEDATITGNIVKNNTNYGINLSPSSTSPTRNSVVAGNRLLSNGSGQVNWTTANAGILFRGNSGWVTENSGTGSIANGATTAVITHGLAITPTAGQINVTFAEQGTNDYGRWWVSTITSTQFTVNVSADPGASNLDFGWNAAVTP